MQPWSWVSHHCVFPIKPDGSGPQSPGTGRHRLSLEGTRSPVPSSVPSPPSWPISPRSSFRSPVKQPEHGAGGAPRPRLAPPACHRLAAALDPPGGVEQALPMIGEDQERAVLGHRPRRQVAPKGRMGVAGPRRWDLLGQRVSGRPGHPRLPPRISFLMSSSLGLHHTVRSAASRGSEATPSQTVTSTLEDN